MGLIADLQQGVHCNQGQSVVISALGHDDKFIRESFRMRRFINPIVALRTPHRRGYTIDQTILIVVIIAILITLVIVTIGWQLINRTSGTKTASQMNQIEQAIGQYYGATRMWPHNSFSVLPDALAPTGFALILAGVTPSGGTLSPNIPTGSLTNYVAGLTINGTTSLRNSHGGDIRMVNATVANWTGASATSQFYVIEFASLPIADARETDRAIDNADDFDDGQFVYSTTSCLPAIGGAAANALGAQPTTGSVFGCYVASALN